MALSFLVIHGDDGNVSVEKRDFPMHAWMRESETEGEDIPKKRAVVGLKARKNRQALQMELHQRATNAAEERVRSDTLKEESNPERRATDTPNASGLELTTAGPRRKFLCRFVPISPERGETPAG